MARITHVKRAQQRYETVPVLDEDGNPKRTPVIRRDGTQKTTKKGKPVFMTVTIQDQSKPLDPYTCDHCRQTIEIGSPMKHITPRSGPYGGRKRTRHEGCPTWQVWDYSSSMSAQLARISYDFSTALGQAESADDVQSALDDAAEAVREIAEQKEESASNIEDGFGHETAQSEELRSTGEALSEWADEIEQADIPEYPEPEESECDDCDGTGTVDNPDSDSESEVTCETCDGTGMVDSDEVTVEQAEEWLSEVQDSLTIVDDSPV